MTDDYKVFVVVDGVTYRGRRSVNQRGNKVWIDGMLVGVDVDNDGNQLEVVADGPVERESGGGSPWWRKLLGR